MPVTDVAIDKIKDMIISGELAPGDRLPKEAELAQRLGLSRSSLREAVKALCLIRVLDVRQGDGTYVTSLEPNLLLDAMTFVVDFHRDDTVLDFLAVRRILEPAATALAALHMSDDDITELGQLLGELEDSPTVEALVANDLQFHRKIADGSGNPVLCSLLDSLSGSDRPRPHLARPHPGGRGREDAGAALGDLRGHRGARAGAGALVGDRARRGRGAVAAQRPGHRGRPDGSRPNAAAEAS